MPQNCQNFVFYSDFVLTIKNLKLLRPKFATLSDRLKQDRAPRRFFFGEISGRRLRRETPLTEKPSRNF